MKYKHIVFDIDGTLIDTENALLHSLQDTIFELRNEKIEIRNLRFAFGIPGDVTFEKLGIKDTRLANRLWDENLRKHQDNIHLFPGVESMIKELRRQGYRLGLITSKDRIQYNNDFLPFGLADYFDTVVCADDSSKPKPAADPILTYLEINRLNKTDILYIGDSVYDALSASNAEVDFGLALWGAQTMKHIYSTYYFNFPREIIYVLNRNKEAINEMPWLKWAMELQFIAQAGITYCENSFDKERFERLREISAEMMSLKSGQSLEQVRSVFCNETGFQTPKLDTRAAIFKDDKILLVEEKNGTWSLPGGWVDVNESIRSNTIKEVKEEAGLDVVPVRIIALQDRNLHNVPIYAYGVCKAFVLCEIIGGHFIPNAETLKSEFFTLDELPLLAEEKNNTNQIRLCFEAYQEKNWETIFD